MFNENFKIEIDGLEATDLYQDLIGVEVDLDAKLSGEFRIYLSILADADGRWTFVDDERLRIWKFITIFADFDEATELLIAGYITHVKSIFDPDPTNCTLEVLGMDASVLMDRQERLKAWPDHTDSDIAAAIFRDYGLTPEVDDTEVMHDEAVSTIIQRETDFQFLARLALRNGYECFVENGTGYFRAPALDEEPQPVLAAHFGEETTLAHFSVQVDALAPADVSMFQLDRLEKEVIDATAESSLQVPLGAENAVALLGPAMEPGRIVVGMNAVTGASEIALLCQGLFDQGSWFITAEGQILGNFYAHVLKPRRTVTIKGVGENHSGVYYVTQVTHSFNGDGYSQNFRAQRNALMPTGAELFNAAAEGLIGNLA